MFKPVRTAKWLAVSIIGWSFIAATLSGCIPANLGRMQTREREITVETLTGSQCAQIAPLWWCNNIAQIQLKSVDFTPLPIEVRKSDQTHYLGHIAVEWSVPGEKAVCTHQWQLTWDKQRITALVAQEDNSGLPPLWVLEPVSVTTADNVTLMTGLISEGQSNAGNQAWDNLIPTVPLVQESVAAVEEAQLGELAQDWDHKAVVEVPSTVGIFAQMMDIPTAVSDQAAAVAHNCGFYDSAVHVIWNPDYEPYDEDEVKHTLTHEITHLATNAPRWQAPEWVIEGVAEYVAIQAMGDIFESGEVKADDLPDNYKFDDFEIDGIKPPSDEQFNLEDGNIDVTYALSYQTVQKMVDKYGWPEARKILAKEW